MTVPTVVPSAAFPLPMPPVSPLDSLDQILADAGELAALPQVVMRVLDLTSDANATAADLEKVIGLDQALAARILALANSAYYGMPRNVSTLHEAVVFLGFKTLRNLAMTITTFNLFLGKSDTPALARRALWRHSVDAAQCARVITHRLSGPAQEAVGAEQAYTCGLLHDIGKMALDRSRHALFVSLTEVARAHHVRFWEIEAEVMPFSHAQIGATLTERWNLPPQICEAIAFHHTPRAASLNPRLTAVTALASEMAHFLEASHGDDPHAWEALHQACAESTLPLRVSDGCLHAMARACRDELGKGLSTLAL